MNEIPKVVFSSSLASIAFTGGAVAHVFAAHS